MEWIKRWGMEISKEPVSPGIYRTKAGGFLIRTTRRENGKQVGMQQTLQPGATIREAQHARFALQSEQTRSPDIFLAFVTRHMESKVALGRLGPQTAQVYNDYVTKQFLPNFGHLRCVDISHSDVKAWFTKLAIDAHYAPRTRNAMLSVLKAFFSAMCAEFRLSVNPADGIDTAETDETYTRERPNTFRPEQLGKFLHALQRRRAHYFPIAATGFMTGLRPSSLRPLRRGVDLLLDERLLLIRRSSPRPGIIVEKTKTKRSYEISLPDPAVAFLREHLASTSGEYVFPGVQAPMIPLESLALAFEVARLEAGIPFPITPKAMRRTFNDISRLAGVSEVVARSISGHRTAAMQIHYSTAQNEEQQAALTRVGATIFDMQTRRRMAP